MTFNKILIFLTIGICLIFGEQLSAQEQLKTEEYKCNFSNYKPLIISHPLTNAVIKKVEPNYSLAAKAVKAQGEVEVKIIVDKQGNVVDACVVQGHPLLSEAAQKAALQWKFKKNFGLTGKQKKRYIQASLFFNFVQEN